MENQITRYLTTKKVIQDFKAKKINLTEKDSEEYIDLIYFFSEQAFKLYNASKTCNPVEFNSIEPKKPENINYNLFANNVLVNKVWKFQPLCTAWVRKWARTKKRPLFTLCNDLKIS